MSALAIAASATLAAPMTAVAQPEPAATPHTVPMVPEGVPVDGLAALAPAVVGLIANTNEVATGPQATLLGAARNLLGAVNLPPEIKSTLERIITFLDGSGGGGPELPGDGPVIAQYLYPTIGKGCIGPGADSVGTALAVPGPAQLPPPGPAAGQTGFVFTALGTTAPAPEQTAPMTVQWLNLDSRKSGVATLTDDAKINHPDGPATLSAIADTGPGRIVSVVAGGLTTQAADAAPISCSFLPTLGFFTVA
ncbi:hypothetical protein GCM10023318_02690 [Nocardia callitridis]|uniref:Secreted protein n=1 Tax=Nocardia callitridis TaxID=648753 RepID=A0ABP9JU53_9NOCA